MLKIYLICEESKRDFNLKFVYPVLKKLHKEFLLIKEQKKIKNFVEIIQILLRFYKDYRNYFVYFYTDYFYITDEKINDIKKFFKNFQFGIINEKNIILVDFEKGIKIIFY